jgi:transposase InsO family protein
MDYFTKWQEAYTIPNQEASTVVEALVANFYHFRVPRELHSDQVRNFESHLIQEGLQCLGVSKTCTTPLHPQSDNMVESYIKTVEEHLRKFALRQRDWDARLCTFLLAFRASTHDATGLTPASLVFGRELHLPCDLLFGASPNKEQPTIDHAANLVDHLHDIYNYAHQQLKLASGQMKLATTDWQTVRATTRATKCGSIAQLPQRGYSTISNPQGRAHTKY